MQGAATFLALVLVASVPLGHALRVLTPGDDASPTVVGSIHALPLSTHFGPEGQYSVTGPAVYLEDVDLCEAGALSGHNVTGKIIVHPCVWLCSFETKYKNMLDAGAVAAVNLFYAEPGWITYLGHDGSQGESVGEPRTMPWVSVYQEDAVAKQLVELLEAGADVTLEVFPDTANPWQDMYSSGAYQFFFRVFGPVCFIATTVLATYHLRDQMAKGKGFTVPKATLSLEIASLPVFAFAMAWGGWCSTSNFSYPVQAMFYTLLCGPSFLSSLLVGLALMSVVNASQKLRRVRGTLWSRYQHIIVPGGIAILCTDQAFGSLYGFFYIDINLCIDLGANAFCVLQMICGSYFIRQYHRFRQMMKHKKTPRGSLEVVDPKTGAARVIKSYEARKTAHLTKWAALSGVGMIWWVIIAPFASVFKPTFWSPWGWCFYWCNLVLSRVFTSYCQVMSFAVLPEKPAFGPDWGTILRRYLCPCLPPSENSSMVIVPAAIKEDVRLDVEAQGALKPGA